MKTDMYYITSLHIAKCLLPVTVVEVPVGPTDNSKMKMKFSENEGGVLPTFMMESYQF